MNLPVVKQGEKIDAWLARSVPALVEQHQLSTEQANRLANQAWQQINGGGDLISQMTGEDSPKFDDESTWGDSVVDGDTWPDPKKAAPGADDPWPDPFSQEDFDALVDSNTDATAPPTDATTPPDQPEPATTQQPPPAAIQSPADGVATLLSTLAQLTTIVEGLQELSKVFTALAPSTEAKKPMPEEEPDPDEETEDAEEEPDPDEETENTEEDPAPEPVAETGDQAKPDKPDPFSAEPPSPKEDAEAKKKKQNPFKGGDLLAVGDVPTTGYMVAAEPERTRVLPAALISEKAIADFMEQNAQRWGDGYMMGGEVNEETGEVTLSAFRHVDTEAKAIQCCVAAGCDTYINLSTGQAETVPVTKSLQWVDEQGFHGPTLISRLGDYRDPGDLAVKALANDRFGGYLCRWGDKDRKDLSGEWFTSKTADLTAVFDVMGRLPALYHHAGDEVVKSAVVGLIDEMSVDDAGLWVEAQARLAKAYRMYVQPLISQKALGWSSGALPRGRRVAKSGEITRWPIVEGSLTPTPFEWRNLTDWPVENIAKAYEMAGLSTANLDKLLKGTRR